MKRGTAATLTLALMAAAACGSSPKTADRGPEVETGPATAVLPVVTLQEDLVELGRYTGPIDGAFSPDVESGLRSFQGEAHVPTSGALDPGTAAALATRLGAEEERPVAALQAALTDMGLYPGDISGTYDAPTVSAVKSLQRRGGLSQTGAFGSRTAAILVELYDRQDPAAESLEQPPASSPASTALSAPESEVLGRGSRGPGVAAQQRRLAELGYRPGEADGEFAETTASALLAFQKREGLERTVEVDAPTRARLGAPAAPGPRSEGPVPRIEVDIARQVAFAVLGSGVTTLNVSTGNNERYKVPGGGTAVAYTPLGSFSIERRVDRIVQAPLGSLYKPMYFLEGWAIHGSPSVPPYPASHGCVRTSNRDQDWLFEGVNTGTPVVVYDSAGTSPKSEPQGAEAGY